MSQLNGFPLVNQLSEPTMDGNPDENAQNNCVPACIAALLEYFTGKTYDGDELKDAIYGQGYTGPMDASHFVTFCQDQGVRLVETTGDSLSLIAATHALIAQGRPVLLTIPSNWNAEPPPTEGSTHVVAAVKEDPGSLTAMNPWGGFWHSGSDSYWEARLRFGSIWSAEAITVGVPANWRDDGKTLVASNGVAVVLGFRQYILSNPWAADDQPQAVEYGVPEVCPSHPMGAGTRQDFTRTSLIYPTTTNGPVQVAPVAADYAHQQSVLAAAQAQIAALQQQLSTTAEPGYVEFKAAVEAMKAALANV